MPSRFRLKLRSEIESSAENRRFGSGWLSGMIALLGSIAALMTALCLLFPALLTTAQLQEGLSALPIRFMLQVLLVLSFGFALLSLFLREAKILGLTAIGLIVLTSFLGQMKEYEISAAGGVATFGLDWFVLNVLFTGMLFLPLERLFPLRREQQLFRQEWREDMFYYFISSMMVQVLSVLTLIPSNAILVGAGLEGLRSAVASQPLILQFLEIMFLTDLMQYWVHRAFHRVPALWHFHAVHHSAKSLDWMAGARMHFIEILMLRGVTVIPMMVLGFNLQVVQAYILVVYIYSTFIHANVRWPLASVSKFLATPRFHHWHHGIEKEAIDVNFAIHFPLFDRMFGTYYMPEGKWPEGYGVGGHPVPQGYMAQFFYPFRAKR